MRYRALDAFGDSTFGSGRSVFYVNNLQAVAQAVLTRLKLMTAEWFLDINEGTPYTTQIIGKNTTGTYDRAVRNRILATEGVQAITSYSSELNRATRQLIVGVSLVTIYGQLVMSAQIPILTLPTS